MATRALISLQGESFTSDFASEYAVRPDREPRLRRSRGFVREGDTVYVSTGAGLSGAKAAVLSIALEAAVVGSLCCLWQLWRLAR